MFAEASRAFLRNPNIKQLPADKAFLSLTACEMRFTQQPLQVFGCMRENIELRNGLMMIFLRLACRGLFTLGAESEPARFMQHSAGFANDMVQIWNKVQYPAAH